MKDFPHFPKIVVEIAKDISFTDWKNLKNRSSLKLFKVQIENNCFYGKILGKSRLRKSVIFRDFSKMLFALFIRRQSRHYLFLSTLKDQTEEKRENFQMEKWA